MDYVLELARRLSCNAFALRRHPDTARELVGLNLRQSTKRFADRRRLRRFGKEEHSNRYLQRFGKLLKLRIGGEGCPFLPISEAFEFLSRSRRGSIPRARAPK